MGEKVSNTTHTADYHETYEKENGTTCPDCRDSETPEWVEGTMNNKTVVNEDADDLMEEAYYAIAGIEALLAYGSESLGFRAEVARVDRSMEQLRRHLFTPQAERVSVYETTLTREDTE